MVLLSPAGMFLVLAAAIPILAGVHAARRTARVRERLGLPAPARELDGRRGAAVVVVLLLGLASAQPALVSAQERRVRTDAEAFLVLDISRSMLAGRPGGATRLTRAKLQAIAIARRLGDVPVGVATLTDRLLPNEFPTTEGGSLERTIRRAVVAERPAPRDTRVRATDFAALGDSAGANLFRRTATHRLFVVLTDGESRPYAEATTARRLRARGIRLVLVHVWNAGDELEQAYRPDPSSRETLTSLAAAADGTVVGDGDVQGATAAARDALGAGPTRARGGEETVRPLAPWIAACAFLPLALVLARRRPGRVQRPSTMAA